VLDGKGSGATICRRCTSATIQAPAHQGGRGEGRTLAEAGFGGGVEITLHGPKAATSATPRWRRRGDRPALQGRIKTTLRTYDFVTYLTAWSTCTGGTGLADRLGSPRWTPRPSTRAVPSRRALRDCTTGLQTGWWTSNVDHAREKLSSSPSNQTSSGSRRCRRPLDHQVDLYGVNKRLNGRRGRRSAQAYDVAQGREIARRKRVEWGAPGAVIQWQNASFQADVAVRIRSPLQLQRGYGETRNPPRVGVTSSPTLSRRAPRPPT